MGTNNSNTKHSAIYKLVAQEFGCALVYIRDVPTFSQIRMCVQLDAASIGVSVTAKPVSSGHSKTKTKVLKTNGSLMNVESIAECSLGAFCNTFGLH